jgi:hypothetical protein
MFSGFRKHWKAYLAWFIGLSVVIYVGVHQLISHSEVFETASSFVMNTPAVIRASGAVREVTLAWNGGSMEVSGGSGSAQLTLNVSGSTSSPQVYVELRKRGIWEVVFARLLTTDGQSVVLRDAAQ